MAVSSDRQSYTDLAQERKKRRKKHSGNTQGSTLPDSGQYADLKEEAIREGWTPEQYQQAKFDSPWFQEHFPGYFRSDGHTTPFSSPTDYLNAYDTYTHIATQYGQAVTKDQFAGLVMQDISPSEFDNRLNTADRITTLAKQSPGGIAAFSKALKELGVGDGSPRDMFEFASGSKLPDLYNAYEAVQIRAGGLDLTNKGALMVSKLLGDGSGAMDLSGAISEITSLRTDISPELKAAGISEKDLLKLKAGGIDKTGDLANKVRQFVAQRRAFGQSSVSRDTGFNSTGHFAERVGNGEADLGNG